MTTPRRKAATPAAKTPKAPDDTATKLLPDLHRLIEEARHTAAVAVNAGLTLLYWRIGQHLHTAVFGQARADYGQEILPTLSAELVPRYGRGFSARSLWRMVQFAQAFPDLAQVSTLAQQLAWSHFQELLSIKDPLVREFYAEMSSLDRWSVRTLRGRIDSMLFERTALSRQPEELIRLELDTLRSKGEVAPTALLKDPYVLDFLGLTDRYRARHDQEPGDLPPLGIILCTGKKQEQIELLELDQSGIHVAEYLTVLPPREVFQQKIHSALLSARARLEQHSDDNDNNTDSP